MINLLKLFVKLLSNWKILGKNNKECGNTDNRLTTDCYIDKTIDSSIDDTTNCSIEETIDCSIDKTI